MRKLIKMHFTSQRITERDYLKYFVCETQPFKSSLHITLVLQTSRIIKLIFTQMRSNKQTQINPENFS